MQTKPAFGHYDLDPETVVITNRGTRTEVCRITTLCVDDDPDLLSFYAKQTVMQSFLDMPTVLLTMKRLVEKVERLRSLNQEERISKEDLIELSSIAATGREVIDQQFMFETITRHGYTVSKSDLQGYFYENEFSTDDPSEDFETRTEALIAAYSEVLAKQKRIEPVAA